MKNSLGAAGPAEELTETEERSALAVTCLAAFLFFNSFGSIGVALPTMQKQFGNSLAEIQWISLMGVVTISSLSFCFGRAGGILGQRRLYKAGVVLYATGAGLGALSTTFIRLLLSRALMAIGLAMALPMSTAILAASSRPDRRGRALGLFAAAIALGRTTGPTIGGLLLHLWDWQAIFWMNCLVGYGVSLAVATIFRGSGARRKEPFDFWGSLTLLVGYPALLIGLTAVARPSWQTMQVLGWFLLAAMGLGSFVVIELRSSKPLIDLQMFRKKKLANSLAVMALSQFVYNPITLSAPLYLQNVLRFSPVTIGLLLAILPLLTVVASPVSGRLADRFEAGRVATLGLVLIFAGVACYARLGAESTYLGVAVALALTGMGIGFLVPANQKTAFASVAGEDYGVLAAMLSSLGTSAGAIGTTMAVALMEMDMAGSLSHDPVAFAAAQSFAYLLLLPLLLLGIAISIRT